MWGDEQRVREDRSEKAIRAFREWAESRYSSLQALNREWDTRFKDWGEVKPSFDLEEVIERDERSATLNFAPWADYREFLEYQFAEMFRKSQKGTPRDASE